MSLLKKILRVTFSTLLNRERRRKLGAFLTNEANGDNNGDPETNGEYAWLTSYLRRMNGARCVAFDVGANRGDWTRIFLANAPQNSEVFCFEPTPATFELLREGLASDSRAVPVNVALGDMPGDATLYVANEEMGTAGTAGTNSLHERKALNFWTAARINVSISTGDAFCSSRGIDRIDVLKIDTEGHEMAVMRGLEQMLGAQRVQVIQFEYGGAWLDARTQFFDAYEFLRSKGYLVAKIFPKGVKFIDVYDQRLDSFAHSNFLAILPALKNSFTQI